MFVRSLVLIAILGLPLPAGAQNRLGGHFGMVLPPRDACERQTTTIGDDFKIGFPMGVTSRRATNGRSI